MGGKKSGICLAGLILALLLGPSFKARAASSNSPSVTVTAGDDEDLPFKPYWENEIGLSFANQQAGQSTNTLSYTGTRHYNEGGDFLSVEADVLSQKVEGAVSKMGAFTGEGGLGLGFFQPSLALGIQAGQGGWRQANTQMTLAFQFWDPLSLNLVFGGNLGSHQGPVSQFYPTVPGTAEVDTGDVSFSFGPAFIPWDWWTIYPTLGFEDEVTYQIQSLNHATVVPVRAADAIASLTLTMDFELFKGFTLELAPETGKEYQPAGKVYSPLTGGLVTNSTSSIENFVGGTLALSYSFE